MKTKIALLIFPLMFGLATLQSCGSGETKTGKDSVAAKGDVYSCPMHPEITSDKPGTCPKCGMDLEKVEK